MKTMIVAALMMLTGTVVSQDTVKHHKLQYFGLHQLGLLTGSSGEKAGVLTTNGVRNGNWYGGISTGIDWYGIRSIPLLASVHKAFGKKRNQPFVYGNAGIQFVWQGEQSFFYLPIASTHRYGNGFAGEAGLGYFLNFKNSTGLSLSAGYSYKEIGTERKSTNVGVDPIIVYTDQYKFYFRRIAIRIGLKI